ncbi:hypothetical protein ACHAXA_003717 [Cyclostephanos tholiformis]|uniref:DNL-type domain-containing protein n=1 Tax=Cyclostephanos tholiformis TaxID=382380 RepID=A0ABD3RZ69_9STRA
MATFISSIKRKLASILPPFSSGGGNVNDDHRSLDGHDDKDDSPSLHRPNKRQRRNTPCLLSESTTCPPIKTSSAFVVPIPARRGMHPPIEYYDRRHNHRHRRHRRREVSSCSASSADDTSGEDAEHEDGGDDAAAISSSGWEGGGLVALPPIGGSSYWDRTAGDEGDPRRVGDVVIDDEDDDIIVICPDDDGKGGGGGARREGGRGRGVIVTDRGVGLVSSKFRLQYTCKVCDARNAISITRAAYRNGVVIAVCRGCDSKHLIADNFGWNKHAGGFDYDNGVTDIETYMANRARGGSRTTNGGIVDGNDDDDDDAMMNDLVKRVSRDVFDLEGILYNDQGGTSGVSFANDDAEGVNKMDRTEDTSWS